MRRIRLRELPCSAVFTPPALLPPRPILPAVLFSTYVQNPDLFSRHVQDPDVTSRGFANARKTQFYINTVNAYSCTVIELNMLEMYLATRSASPHTQIGLGKLCEWTETEIKQTFWRFTYFSGSSPSAAGMSGLGPQLFSKRSPSLHSMCQPLLICLAGRGLCMYSRSTRTSPAEP